ncbi:MAG: cytochrome c [Anaerolineae bacterium]
MTGRPTWLLIILSMFLVALTSCANPQPLPVAPTTIPTLIPATLPPEPTATLRPAALGVVFPSRQPSARAASALYQQNCANCHGVDGQGLVPNARNLSDADYMRGQSPLRFYQIISDGRNEMPAWQNEMPVDNRWDLAFYTWSFATPSDMLDQGKAVFQQNCVTCHGPDGKGVVPGTPDFTNVESVAGKAPSDFFQVVTEGKGTMPSWQGRLSPDERWAAIEYMRTFAYEPASSPGAATSSQAPPAASPTEEPTATPLTKVVGTSEAGAEATGGDAANGEQLFVDNGCVACHGDAGEGGVGPALAGIEDGDEELFDAIKNGKTGTAMVAFGASLSDNAIRDLLAFIRQLE